MSYQVRVLNRQNTDLFFLRLSSQKNLYFNDDPIEIFTNKVLFSKDLYLSLKEFFLETAATCEPFDPIRPVEEFLSEWFLSMCHSMEHQHISPDNQEKLKILIEDAYQFRNANKIKDADNIKKYHSFRDFTNLSEFIDRDENIELILPRTLFSYIKNPNDKFLMMTPSPMFWIEED
jgi:hypothetical protein